MNNESRSYRSRNEAGGGRHRGGGNRFRDDRRSNYQRRPYERPVEIKEEEEELEDIEIRLKGLIIKIGDKISSDLQINLTKMRNILANDYGKYPDTVQDTLKACVTELPAKAPVYGTLIGLLNSSDNAAVTKLMSIFNRTFEEAVAESNWFRIKQLLRFYGELVNANVILPSVYCTILNDLLIDLDEPNQLRQRLDCIVYIILATLPWCGRELADRTSSEFDQILKKIEIYMHRRGSVKNLKILDPYNGEKYDIRNEDGLAHLWSLTLELQDRSWHVPLIPKPYRWFDSEFNSALQHDTPRLSLPVHNDSVKYIAPIYTMKLWTDDNGKTLPTIPDHGSIEYFVLQETISDTMNLFEVNRKDCAKYLLGIPNSFEARFFKSTHSSDHHDDKSRDDDMEVDDSKWSLSDLLVEASFSQLLNLPSSPVRQVFYSCVFIELCRAESSTFPLALGRGVKTLFERLADVDVECIHRFYCWFSHHLSNFGFQWDWKAWEYILTLDPLNPKVCFVRETLEKVVRLSYYERIKSILPADFHVLLQPIAPSPDFAYKDINNPLHDKAKIIVEAIRTKKSIEELKDMLSKYKEEQAAQGADEQQQQMLVREMFVQCLLLVGSKSFSHILNVVERYLDVLRYVNTTPDGRLHTVQTVASFWKNNTQFLGILLDKLLNYRVIDPTSVITWVFEPEQLKHVGRSFVWEILINTLNKVVSRVVQVKSKLDSLKEVHEQNKNLRAASEMTELAEAEAQQELDSIRIVESSLASVTREQKEVFMIVYQKFVQSLQELIASNGDKDIKTNWTFWWLFGWYKEVLRVYYKECRSFMTTLETLVFTSDLDKRITDVFTEVRELQEECDILV
ncbi:armadillo-type protein [Pilobolus umbonatus]|nr:armadillo-type protein [Pilobolus umbonatus]